MNMAQSNNGRIIAIAIITLNAVISVVLVMAVVYLFFQVSHLQEENRNLRSKWQRLQATHSENDQNTNTDSKRVNWHFNIVSQRSTCKDIVFAMVALISGSNGIIHQFYALTNIILF